MGRKFKKKLIENLTIVDIADRGKYVAKNEEGQVVFVEDVAPGDVVDVLVYKKRKGYLLGSVKEIKKYSFYNSNNIFVIDRDNIELEKVFFESNFNTFFCYSLARGSKAYIFINLYITFIIKQSITYMKYSY